MRTAMLGGGQKCATALAQLRELSPRGNIGGLADSGPPP